MNQTTSGWRKRQIAMDKKAENARELGLDYKPSIISMTKDEALKLALETLEYAGPLWIDARQPAITAIKEALAQPEPTGQAPCERHCEANAFKIVIRGLKGDIERLKAQPEQAPVAKIDSLEQEIYENTREFVSLNVMEWLLNRLNTTPIIKSYLEKDNLQRTWVGLTDDDLKLLSAEWRIVYGAWMDDFARDIEAKLRSKNT